MYQSVRLRRLLLPLVLLTVPTLALAGQRLTDFQSSCTTLNCSALVITSTYGHDQFSNADPSVFQVFTSGNECLRIAVSSQGTDLEGTLTCPNGRTWQNDDGNGSLRPLIRANTAAPRGWCTLTFHHFAGEGSAADFTFTYGRYPAGNVNCAGAPAPDIFLRAQDPEADDVGIDSDDKGKPEDGGDRAPRRGGTMDLGD